MTHSTRQRLKRNYPLVLTVMFVAAASLTGHSAMAQFGSSPGAAPAAYGTLRFSVFGGFTDMMPDVGLKYKTYSSGFVVGGTATRHFRLFDVALEPRYGKSFNPDAKEDYVLGNGKIGRTFSRFSRFHPYGFGGIGYGIVHYPQNLRDDSMLYDLGAGVDVDLTSHWSAKAEWQYQYWNVGKETDGFNPNGLTVGAIYNFHFSGFSHRR